MRQLPIVALAVASVLGAPNSSQAVLQSPDEYCSVAKLKATARALDCYLRAQIKLAAGDTADPTTCTIKHAARFGRAEGIGGCLTSGDSAVAAGRSEQTAALILGQMDAGLVSDRPGLACLKGKAKLVSRYAKCQTKALASRVYGTYRGLREDFVECRADFHADYAEIDATGDCPSTGEAAEVEELAPGGFAFLPSANLRYQDLDNAPLSYAYLVDTQYHMTTAAGADFRGADFTNAEIGYFTVSDTVPTDFRDAIFDGADIGIDFHSSLLAGAQLANANLYSITSYQLPDCPASLPPGWSCMWGYLFGPNARVDRLDLSGQDISGMSFPGVEFSELDLTSAIVHNVDFTGASLWFVRLDGADLTGTDLSVGSFSTPVQSLPLVACPAALPIWYQCFNQYIIGHSARLSGADFSGADLSGSYLYGWRLTSCDLSGANLSNTEQISAHFVDSDLTGADVTGAKLYSTYWTNTICPDGTNSDANGNTCCGHFVGGLPQSCS